MDDRQNEVLRYIVESLPRIGSPKFFYLRYLDEIGWHLRVRFQYPGENEAQRYLPSLQNLLRSFREYGLIDKIQFDLYCRENNRYGGSQLIQLAEQVFFADSHFVVGLFQEFDVDEADQLEEAYLLGICTMLTAFFDQQEKMLKQVDLVPLLDESKKMFRKKKQGYIEKIEQWLIRDFSGLSEQTNRFIQTRAETIKAYRDGIRSAMQLTNTTEAIIASVIHMFCNRLTGDKRLEQKYLNITREALSNIIEKDKRLIKKEI